MSVNGINEGCDLTCDTYGDVKYEISKGRNVILSPVYYVPNVDICPIETGHEPTVLIGTSIFTRDHNIGISFPSGGRTIEFFTRGKTDKIISSHESISDRLYVLSKKRSNN